jgi:3-deoxy-D-manno-octulosonic-acid transferase
MLKQMSQVLAQSVADAERYRALGAEQVTCVGNMKLDINTTVNAQVLATLQQVLGLQSATNQPVLLLASTQPGEEALFMDELMGWLNQGDGYRVIVAPRHPERADDVVALFEQAIRQADVEASICKRSSASVDKATSAKVIILDTIGELSTLYRLVVVAIIGGSFLPKRGGQNPLEALAAGVPVITGPHMKNFRHIMALVSDYHAGVQVTSPQEAMQHAKALVDEGNKQQANAMVEAGYRLLADNKGATDKTFAEIQSLLQE